MDIAIIHSAGLTGVSVSRSPTIRVISTGNELVPAGAPIEPHQVRLSNGPAVIALLQQHGYQDCQHDHLVDDPEVLAERIAAPPGGMSYVSVFVQYHAQVELAFDVPAAAFEPAPDVDSAIIVGVTRERRLDADLEDELWRLVQAGFRERRKMIHNVLVRQLAGDQHPFAVRRPEGLAARLVRLLEQGTPPRAVGPDHQVIVVLAAVG